MPDQSRSSGRNAERCEVAQGPDDDQSFWREYLLYHRSEGFAFPYGRCPACAGVLEIVDGPPELDSDAQAAVRSAFEIELGGRVDRAVRRVVAVLEADRLRDDAFVAGYLRLGLLTFGQDGLHGRSVAIRVVAHGIAEQQAHRLFHRHIVRAFRPVDECGVGKGLALLAKLKTVLSLFLSVGVYAIFWGWRFALGFVLLMFVHELGHVVAFKAQGKQVTGMMFIPLFGAYTEARDDHGSVAEQAWSAIAGPIAGAASAYLMLYAADFTDSLLLRALAYTAFLLNVFNLIPMLPLLRQRAITLCHLSITMQTLVLIDFISRRT